MTYKIWANDGYDGWEMLVEAGSFEEAIQKAGGVMPFWMSITDGTETRRFPDEKNKII
jgi:hypothetical protein